MEQEHIKVFAGTSIIVNRLNYLLEKANIHSIIKDHIASGNAIGFGTLGNSVELFILNTDIEKANTIINNFQKEISE